MLIVNRLELRDRPRPGALIGQSDESQWADGQANAESKGYLEMFSLFRVIACLAVLGQHSFIWTNMSGNFVGTGFITMLHLSRNSFFFLSGLVVCYAQTTHPRSLRGLWKRRYSEIGVPYLAWTGIYLIFSLITINASWDEAGVFLRHTVFLGFSQMYFIGSLGSAMVIGYAEHYPSRLALVSDVLHSVNSVLPMSRDFFSYQEFFVAGMLVALHLDQVLAFVGRRHRQILVVTGVAGVLTVLWYMVSVWAGNTVERASDVYEPASVVWCFAAIGGMLSISWWWDQRARTPRALGRRSLPYPYLAGLTGCVFFAHTLFINIIRSALDATGLRASLPWEAIVSILFVVTVSVTFTFGSSAGRYGPNNAPRSTRRGKPSKVHRRPRPPRDPLSTWGPPSPIASVWAATDRAKGADV